MDKYRNFNELMQYEIKGVDYDIQMRCGTSGIAVIAPHGGGIEPGTADIADSVAGGEHTLYCFIGLKETGNTDLHITSENFDEPIGVRTAEEADFVLTIHGCSGAEEVIYIGGHDLECKKRFSHAIALAGFDAKDNPMSGLAGLKPSNICNRGKTGRGVQIELSRGLREKLFENMTHHIGKGKRKEISRGM